MKSTVSLTLNSIFGELSGFILFSITKNHQIRIVFVGFGLIIASCRCLGH